MRNDEFARDVAQLETLLRELAPRGEFWQAIELEGGQTPDVDIEIGWAEHGKYRLLYCRARYDENDEAIDEDRRPLVDAPEELRKELHAFLPLFMEEFVAHVKEGADEDED